MIHPTDTFSARVRWLREQSGLSATHLSRLANFRSPSLVGLLERGKRGAQPSANTVASLARVCGASAEWLRTGEGERPTPDGVRAAVARAMSASNTGTEGA